MTNFFMPPEDLDDLEGWLIWGLVSNQHDYELVEEPIQGTYGQVLIFRHGRHSFALKTLKAAALTGENADADPEVFAREFRIWLNLKPHPNIVGALETKNETVHLPALGPKRIPTLRMRVFDGTVEDWIDGRVEVSQLQKLISLLEAVKGLQALYSSGIEGHGDLKPTNILYTNLWERSGSPEAAIFPRSDIPYQTAISDLGWADAWRDLGFWNKAAREYMSPERQLDIFVAEKSDIFAMGLIAAELLGGSYPGNLKKIQKSPGGMRKVIESSEWDLEGIESTGMKGLIAASLELLPEDRPTPEEWISAVGEELNRLGERDLSTWIRERIRDLPPDQEADRLRRSLGQSSRLSRKQAESNMLTASQRLRETPAVDLLSADAWSSLAAAVIDTNQLLGEVGSLSDVRSTAIGILQAIFNPVDNLAVIQMPSIWHGTSVQPYEWFSEVSDQLLAISGLTKDEAIGDANLFSQLVRSCFAFRAASDTRHGGGGSEVRARYLAEAIRLAPEEAVPYYFRARWQWEDAFRARPKLPKELTASQISDLDRAKALAPDWESPRKFRGA